MRVTISPTATNLRPAYGGAPPRITRLEAHRQDAPRRDPRASPGALGYDGLQQALAHLPSAPSAVPATLLTALIHTMGGATTSVSRGLYVNTLT